MSLPYEVTEPSFFEDDKPKPSYAVLWHNLQDAERRLNSAEHQFNTRKDYYSKYVASLLATPRATMETWTEDDPEIQPERATAELSALAEEVAARQHELEAAKATRRAHYPGEVAESERRVAKVTQLIESLRDAAEAITLDTE